MMFVGLSNYIAANALGRPGLGAFVLPLAMVSVVGQAAYTITDLGLTGLGRFDRAGQLQALQGLTRLVVSVGLVVLGLGVAGGVAGYTAGFTLSGLLESSMSSGNRQVGGSINVQQLDRRLPWCNIASRSNPLDAEHRVHFVKELHG